MSDEWKWDSEIWPFLFEGNSRSIEESILLLGSFEPDRGHDTSLRDGDAEAIIDYLQNPTRQGVWLARAKWETQAEISQEIWRDLSSKFTKRENSIILRHSEEKIKISLKGLQEIREAIHEKVSFFLFLFHALLAKKVKAIACLV